MTIPNWVYLLLLGVSVVLLAASLLARPRGFKVLINAALVVALVTTVLVVVQAAAGP